MRIIFAGAERAASRNALLDVGVTDLAINLSAMNVPKKKKLDLEEMKGGATLTVYVSPDSTLNLHDSFLHEHVGNLDRVVGDPSYDGRWLGDLYWPIWNDPEDIERFSWLVETYGRVAVGDDGVKADKIRRRVQAVAGRWGAELMVISSKLDTIAAIDWESAIVGSWDSVRKFGETQVWDFTANRLHRYPAESKAKARKDHLHDIERLGVNPDDVQADDVSACRTLAIRSWQMLAAYRTTGYSNPIDTGEEPDAEPVATTGSRRDGVEQVVTSRRDVATGVAQTRHEREQRLLPGWSSELVKQTAFDNPDDQAEGIDNQVPEVPVIRAGGSSLRQCDSCSLQHQCPAFQPAHVCAYNMPVTITERGQLNAVMMALTEMHIGRVMFASFAEQLEGTVLDSDLSKAIDQVFGMIAKMAELNEKGDVVRMTLEAKGGSAGGMLSKLFGGQIGAEARKLPGGPLDAEATNRFIDTAATELRPD